MKTTIKIVGTIPVDELRDGLPVPALIELVNEHAVELREVLDDAHDDFEESVQVRRRAELLVDLRHHSKDIHHAYSPALPAPFIWPRARRGAAS